MNSKTKKALIIGAAVVIVIAIIVAVLIIVGGGNKNENPNDNNPPSKNPSSSTPSSSNPSENPSTTTTTGSNGGGIEDIIVTPDIKEEDIVFSSPFSNGRAVVNLIDEKDKAYVIDKNGKIVFDIELEPDFVTSTIKYMNFENGLLYYDGVCYDINGTKYTADMFGGTKIVGIHDKKYIVIEKITSDYASAKTELGVLDYDFKWILPFSEANYSLYHTNLTTASDFFWYELVEKRSSGTKIYEDDRYGYIYVNDGTLLKAEDVGSSRFRYIADGKYIVAQGENYKTIGILNLAGEWIIQPNEYLAQVDDSWGSWFEVGNDRLFVFHDGTFEITNLQNGSKISMDSVELWNYYSSGNLITGIISRDGRVTYEKGEVDTSSVYDFNISIAQNGKYVFITAERKIGYKYESDDNEWIEEDTYLYFVNVLDADMNYIFKDLPSNDSEIKGDYLKIELNDSEEYYNLNTGATLANKPSDYETAGDEGNDYDDYYEDDSEAIFYDIPNHATHTDFVNGRAAVAIWNSVSKEMYIALVNEQGDFIFNPVKTPISEYNHLGFSIFYDGEFIVISDDYTAGTATIDPMIIYSYNSQGELIDEFHPSSEMSNVWLIKYEYSDGVFVFYLSTGEYSDYYRQSRVRYMTHNFESLFN